MNIEQINSNKNILDPLIKLSTNLNELIRLFEKFNLTDFELYEQLKTTRDAVDSFDCEALSQESIWSRRKRLPVQ